MNVGDEQTTSLWMGIDVAPDASRLETSKTCDVLIVGAGIAGLSCAYELADLGRAVIVIDRGEIGHGMSARTTAHLAPVCDDTLSALIDLRGAETASLFQKSHEAAVDRIEELVGEHKISCDFRRLDGNLFPALNMENAEAKKQLDKEYEAAGKINVDVKRAKGVPFKGFETAPVLRYPRQATFHPLKYLKGLVEALRQKDVRFFTNSAAVTVEERDESVVVTTENGSAVTARHVIFATNSPINDRIEIHSKMAPYRTYAMAFTIPRGTIPDGLYWDLADPYHYVRLNLGPGSVDYLIAGGADHKTGEVDDGSARFEAVEAWIRQLVPALGKEIHRWSGQVLDTLDYCGFIGRDPGTRNIYIVTGDSGQGMTQGVLSGILLKDLIVRGDSPWKDVYEPSRKTPKGIVNYVRENFTAVKNFAEYLLPGEIGSLDELARGAGAIWRDGANKVAAYRDPQGTLYLHSAACTHLGCIVHWNSTESCWDCPCHGSQFTPKGEVLNGPAITPLPPYEMKNSSHKI